jgi:hypothetical protein
LTIGFARTLYNDAFMRWGLSVLLLALFVAFAAPAGASERATVTIFAPRTNSVECAGVFPLKRTVVRPRLLFRAMSAVVAGPTAAERRRGYTGFFSAKTANTVLSAVTRRGVAYVDFADFSTLIPNASSSCGSTSLLAQLDRTARQFPGIRRTIYSFNGSRQAFYEWLQRPVPKR